MVAAYRQLAVKEKNEREKSKYVRKRNYTMLMVRIFSIPVVGCNDNMFYVVRLPTVAEVKFVFA